MREDDGMVVRGRMREAICLDTDTSLTPMSSLRVVSVRGVMLVLLRVVKLIWWAWLWRWEESVPDGVTSSQSDPLRNRSVLLLSFRKLLLRAEGLVALRSWISSAFALLNIPSFNHLHHPLALLLHTQQYSRTLPQSELP